ncbi:MAG TPA: hypothetical protein VIR98_01035 [Candidatus Paceibacterota bacterium]|jgi:hypothetical protein
MKKPLYILVFIIVLVVLYVFIHHIPTQADYKTGTYLLVERQVTLGAGEATYFGNEVRGDFDKDGREDAAFVIQDQPGGSGTFYYIALALGTDSGLVPANALLLGDRIAPQTTEFKDGKIIVNYMDRKPTEPMSAPVSVGVTANFEVRDGKLVAAEK